MNQNTKFLKNSLLNFTSNILLIIIGLFSTVLIARLLGPEGQGVYTLIILLPTMLVTFLNLGIGPATVYFTGSKKYSLNTIISTNIVLSFILSIVAVIIGLIAILIFKGSTFEGAPTTALLTVLFILPFLFFSSFMQAIYQGTENFKRYNYIQISSKLIQILTLIIMVFFVDLSLRGVLSSFIIGNCMPSILILLYLLKDKVKINLKDFSLSLTFDFLKYGYRAHLSNIVAFLNYRLDILMISFFLNPMAVGIYNVAVAIAERLWIFSQPLSTTLFPRISTIKNENERSILTAKVARNTLYISAIFGLIFFMISDVVVFLLFGEEYSKASIIIKILLFGITFFAAERILSNYFAGTGTPEINLYTGLITLISNAILNVILIPKYGISGASLSTSISYSLTFFVKIFLFSNTTKINVLEILVINKNDFRMYKALFTKITERFGAS